MKRLISYLATSAVILLALVAGMLLIVGGIDALMLLVDTLARLVP